MASYVWDLLTRNHREVAVGHDAESVTAPGGRRGLSSKTQTVGESDRFMPVGHWVPTVPFEGGPHTKPLWTHCGSGL